MGLEEPDLPVHAKHYRDGFPLCWPQDQMGTFEGSFDEGEVTCSECLYYLKEV